MGIKELDKAILAFAGLKTNGKPPEFRNVTGCVDNDYESWVWLGVDPASGRDWVPVGWVKITGRPEWLNSPAPRDPTFCNCKTCRKIWGKHNV